MKAAEKFVLALLAGSAVACMTGERATPPSPKCPPAGTEVPLDKAVSAAFLGDYVGCDIVVEAIFFKMGNEGYMLSDYDTKANTTFQVLAPGGVAQQAFGTSYGNFAGIPKAQSEILFQLKQGDAIVLRGAPISYTLMGTTVATVFHARSVTKE